MTSSSAGASWLSFSCATSPTTTHGNAPPPGLPNRSSSTPRDPRPYTYTLAQLERAETHDDLWNAAQCQMVSTGWMHNSMRMYWAKKILEWAPDPATAFDWAVILNDRYELDGRDPNGYAGIAWAIVGKLDRPWFNRPIFGLVRSMSGASFARNSTPWPTSNSNAQPVNNIRQYLPTEMCPFITIRALTRRSYNGPQFQTRKMRVSLRVIPWIPRSFPLEDFYGRGRACAA